MTQHIGYCTCHYRSSTNDSSFKVIGREVSLVSFQAVYYMPRHIKKKQDEHIAAQELIEDVMKTVDGTAKREVDVSISYSHSICPVIRKHGCWKCRNVLPSTWLVLTVITLSAQHIVSFTSQGSHHREIFLGSLSRTISHDDHRTQVTRCKTPFREW
eukprot:scaffold5392_cov173-Amphora_coffeaeformis.AAC.1